MPSRVVASEKQWQKEGSQARLSAVVPAVFMVEFAGLSNGYLLGMELTRTFLPW
jgi:hypothetical protein